METNILGLPSFTGFTPLKAAQEGQVLKYDFRGIGPRVIDKSGNGNAGKLKPRDDPPKRKVQSFFPLKVVMDFDGEDYIEVPDSDSLTRAYSGSEMTVYVKLDPTEEVKTEGMTTIVSKGLEVGTLRTRTGDVKYAFRGREYPLGFNVKENQEITVALYKENGTIRIDSYDGEELVKSIDTGKDRILGNDKPLLVGSRLYKRPYQGWIGTIDTVEIFDSKKTPPF